MGLLEFIIYAAIIGFIAWVVTKLIPMPEPIAKIIYVVAILVVLLILLRAIGFTDMQIPRVR